MCRTLSAGGRRCPCEAPDRRRSRQNAAYRKKKARSADTPRPANPDVPDTETSAPATNNPAAGTPEHVRQQMQATRDLLDKSEPLTRTGRDGFPYATEHGLTVEASVRQTGEAVDRRAADLRAPALAELDAEHGGRHAAYDRYGEAMESVRQEFEQERERWTTAVKENDWPPTEADPGTYRQARTEHQHKLYDLMIQEKDLYNDRRAVEGKYQKVISDGYRDAVAEQRGLGPNQPVPYAPTSHAPAKRLLESAHAYYPSDWLDKEQNPVTEVTLNFKSGRTLTETRQMPMLAQSGREDSRAYYSHTGHRPPIIRKPDGDIGLDDSAASTIKVGPDTGSCLESGVSTALHEYGHRSESLHPQINEVCHTFLARRTTSDGARHPLTGYTLTNASATEITTYSAFGDRSNGEWVRPDGFVDQYVGKQCASGNSEVFSTGMEGVFAGGFGGLTGNGGYKADLEHRNLILGILTTVRGSAKS